MNVVQQRAFHLLFACFSQMDRFGTQCVLLIHPDVFWVLTFLIYPYPPVIGPLITVLGERWHLILICYLVINKATILSDIEIILSHPKNFSHPSLHFICAIKGSEEGGTQKMSNMLLLGRCQARLLMAAPQWGWIVGAPDCFPFLV